MSDKKTEIAEFSATDAAIAQLTIDYQEKTLPDVKTDDGYKYIAEGIKKVRGLRTKLEKKRKEIKQPVIDQGKLIDSEAKRITKALLELEEPMRALKSEVDEREAREKEKRINEQKERIQKIVSLPRSLRSATSKEITKAIDELTELDCTQCFYELKKDALSARSEALEELAEMLSQTLRIESIEEENKKNREAQALEERRKQIQCMPLEFLGETSSDIQGAIDTLRQHDEPEFQDVVQAAVNQLEIMLENTRQIEKTQIQESSEIKTEETLTAKVKKIIQKQNEGEKSREFYGADVRARMDTKESLDVLACYFFGLEAINEILCDSNGNEYELDLVLERRCLKEL